MSRHRDRHDRHDRPDGSESAHWHGGRGRRFFRSGELPLVLLALVAQRPQHGYELMAELDARFGPAYRPSPGSIYPALSALEAEGLLAAREEGDKKVFSATDPGRKALTERAAMLAAIEARTGVRLAAAELEPALSRLVARVRAVASQVDVGAAEAALDAVGSEIEGLATRPREREVPGS